MNVDLFLCALSVSQFHDEHAKSPVLRACGETPARLTVESSIAGGDVSKGIPENQMSMVYHEWNPVVFALLVQQHTLLFRVGNSVQLSLQYTA